MEIDISGGIQMGYHTVLVLSGSTRPHDLSQFAYMPDNIVDSLANLHHTQLVEELSEVVPDAMPVNRISSVTMSAVSA